jgi:hypothetical protein
MKALYVRLCLRWGPVYEGKRITISAWAHIRARNGRPWLRNRIDGAALLFFGEHQHSQASFQRGRSRFTNGD